MFSVISRAVTPAPRARRTIALTLALALGAVPVTSAVSAQPAAHAARTRSQPETRHQGRAAQK